MKTRPILFSAPMVRALLEGRKTQTRRVVKPQPILQDGFWRLYGASWSDGIKSVPAMPGHSLSTRNPYGKPGDLLWVREAWQLHARATDLGTVVYRASINDAWSIAHELIPVEKIGRLEPKPFQQGWRPSLHMPRWASRLTLELTEVRVQRLQEISEADAYAEGCNDEGHPYLSPFGGRAVTNNYAALWESINGRGSWEANPWVWALTFRVHQQNIDELIKSREAA